MNVKRETSYIINASQDEVDAILVLVGGITEADIDRMGSTNHITHLKPHAIFNICARLYGDLSGHRSAR